MLRRIIATVSATTTVVAGALTGLTAPNSQAATPTVTYLSTMTIPDSLSPFGIKLGGLSGIDQDGNTGRYIAISDDKGDYGPPRAYNFTLPISPTGQFTAAAPHFTSITRIQGPGPMAKDTYDMESIRYDGPDLVVSSEGNYQAHITPFIRLLHRNGDYIRDFPLPTPYVPDYHGTRGARDNLNFEGLSVDGGILSTLTENSLYQDGPQTGPGRPSTSRLLQYNMDGSVKDEFVYEVSGTDATAPAKADMGASELMGLGDNQFLVIERGYNPVKKTNTVRIYWTTTQGATPVTGKYALSGTETPMPKKLLFDFASVPHLESDNVEGITWGPTLSNGRRTLVLISDNNFTPPTQHTKIHLLAYSGGAAERT